MKTFKLITLCFTLFLLISCNSTQQEKPIVVSTIGMIHSMVEEIASHNVTAIALMGPGVDPHLYKASAGDVKKLTSADLILYNGLHLEAKLIDILSKLNQPAIAVTDSIPKEALIKPHDYDGFYDPHVWFDVSLWQYAATEVFNALVFIDPQNKEEYAKNHTKYQERLSSLDLWIQQKIDSIPTKNRLLVTAHDAFNYFGKKYQFKVVGLQGINTSSEAGTKDIQKTTRIIIENQTPTIFIESSVPVRQIQALKAAVEAKGRYVEIGDTLFTDALGTKGTIEATYIGMIRHNVNSIVNGLK